MGILLTGLVSGNSFDSTLPIEINILLGTLLALGGLVFLVSYPFLLYYNPDSLRTEGFALEKMAIERGLYGDNLVGVFDPSKKKPSSALPTDPKSGPEEENE